MTQDEFDRLRSDDELIKALENMTDLLTAMSETDTAITLSISTLEDNTTAINDNLTVLNKALDQAFDDVNGMLVSIDDRLVDIANLTAQNTNAVGNALDTLGSQFADYQAAIINRPDSVNATIDYDSLSSSLKQALNTDSTASQATDNSGALLTVLQSSLKIQTTAASSIADMSKILNEIYNNKIDDRELKEETTFLTTALQMIRFIAENKNAKNYKNNAALFASGTRLLIEPVRLLLQTYSNVENAAKALDKVTDLFDQLGKSVQSAGKSIALIVGATIAMTAAIALMDWNTIGKFAVAFPILCSGMAAGVWILSKAGDEQNLRGIQNFALAVGILSVSLFAFQFMDWETIVAGTIGVTALATGLALACNLLPTKAIAQFSKNIVMFTASIGMLAIGIAVVGMIVEMMPWQALAKGAAVMLVAGGVLWLASLLIKKGADDIGKSMGWMAIGLVAFGLSLYAFQELIEGIEWETWAIAASSILGLAGTAWLLGRSKVTWQGIAAIGALVGALTLVPLALRLYDSVNWDQVTKMVAAMGSLGTMLYVMGMQNKSILLGAAGLAAGAGALFAVGFALKQWPDTDWEDLGKVGTVIAGIVAALYLAGANPVMTIAGAAALAGAGGALILMAKGLDAWPTRLTMKDYAVIAGGIATVTAAIALIGNPLTLPFILTGIAEAAALGGAIYSLGRGLEQAQKINFPAATKAATALVNWAKDSIKIIASMKLKDMVKANFGLGPFQKLGTALASIAVAVNSMAAGTYNEYATMPDGTVKIVATHNIGPEQYAAVGEGIKALLNSITKPLQEFGKGGGFLRDSDAENGMDALKNIGDIVNPMLTVAKEADKVKTADYSGFGIALDNLIKGIKAPLESVGKGSSWLTSNDFEDGIKVIAKLDGAIKPVLTIADKFKAVQQTDYSKFGTSLTTFINGMKKAFIGLDEDDFEDGIDAMDELQDAVKPMTNLLNMATSFSKFTAAQSKAFTDTVNTIITNIRDFATADTNLPNSSRLAQQLKQVNKSFDKLNNKNLRLIVETAHAVDSIANANLSNIARAKSEVSKQLFDRLQAMYNQLVVIKNNTKPKDVERNVIKLNEDGTWKDEFRLEDGQEVTLTTIAMQLDQLYGLLAANRTTSAI